MLSNLPSISSSYFHHLLSRYVLGYKGNARQQCAQSRGLRASGMKVVHVVTASCSAIQLQSLLSDRLLPQCSSDDTEIQVSTAHTYSMTKHCTRQVNFGSRFDISYNSSLFTGKDECSLCVCYRTEKVSVTIQTMTRCCSLYCAVEKVKCSHTLKCFKSLNNFHIRQS